MFSLEPMTLGDLPSENGNGFKEFNIFQTASWLNFVAKTQKAKPVVAAVQSDGRLVGYFTGLIVRKYGVKILGSPFRGWTTDFMGLSLIPGVSRRDALKALLTFAFDIMRCHYLEVIDIDLSIDDCNGLSYRVEVLPRFIIDLKQSEEDLFANMKHSCRNAIRKSIKSGVVIEEAFDNDFAGEHYAQLVDVFEKQSMVPPHGLDRIQLLIEQFLPTKNLLLLRARNSEGDCIATGIFLALNKAVVFWGAASWKKYQKIRPNEPLAWYAMKYWKSRGIETFYFGGGWSQYKSKFGSEEIQVFRLMKAKYGLLDRFMGVAALPKSSQFRNWVLRKILR